MSVTLVRSGSDAPPRVAYAIGKRVGPAVVRNRVRRQLREVARAHAHLMVAGGAYLVSVGPDAAGLPFWDLSRHLVDALRSVGDGS